MRAVRMTEALETPDFKVWLGDDGVFRLKYTPGTQVTLDMMEKGYEYFESVREGKSHPVMVFLDDVAGIDREARVFALNQIFSATALVGASPIARIIGNMAIGFNKKVKTPTRMFASEEDALEWLQSFKV